MNRPAFAGLVQGVMMGQAERFMRGKTIVITGGTSGIGEVAAIRLAEKGARIVLVARDTVRAAATLAKLRAANPVCNHVFHIADLSLMAETKRVGEELALREAQIDVLINNAGALFNRRAETAEGLEKTFATNHMAYFVLTNRLLDKLKAAPGARIICTSSDAHKGNHLDFDDLQSLKHYRGFAAYGRSKLCNILFTRELARRIAGSGITANALHPGFVATRFGEGSGGMMQWVVALAKPLGAISPEAGAKTIIYLACSPEVANDSGDYFTKCKCVLPSRDAQNDADAKRLWDVSAKIAGVP
jgi:NAD(P)-dependent dehydrogenase (short-subunit alcohol dehydrogenase family)